MNLCISVFKKFLCHYVFAACSKLHEVLFLALSALTFFFGICTKFTGMTCLVARSDKFECQGKRSRSPGTKNVLCTPITSPCSDGMERACMLQKTSRSSRRDHSVTAGRVISVACMRFMFSKTSLALVRFAFPCSRLSWLHMRNISLLIKSYSNVML